MKHWMQRCILLLALLLTITASVGAYEVPTDFSEITIDDAVEEFMQAHGLNASNFSVSYTNTVTGERYAYNDKAFMVAASTYKLPLNMYYYELEHQGTMAPDVYISRVGGTLDEAHYQSLVYSNNDMSIGMLYNLGEFRDYKNLMKRYFTMPEEEIEYVYYVDNYYCTNMMMDALLHLYEYRADFDEMIGYMKQAQPGEYFKAGVTDYEVAHKYGVFEGAVNDVGIIYTPQPFLLAVYTQGVSAQVVSDAAKLFTAYTLWQDPPESEGQQLELEVNYIPDEPAEEEDELPVVELTQQEERPLDKTAFEWWMVLVALGVFCIGGGIVILMVSKKKKLEEKIKK